MNNTVLKEQPITCSEVTRRTASEEEKRDDQHHSRPQYGRRTWLFDLRIRVLKVGRCGFKARSRFLIAATVSPTWPGSMGGLSSGPLGGGVWVSVPGRERAAATAHTARAAMTRTVWRRIALYSLTWAWSRPN